MAMNEMLTKTRRALAQLVFSKRYPELARYTREYTSYLELLFARVANTNAFDCICTLLRVEGIKGAHWDAFVESEEAATDFAKLLRSSRRRNRRRVLRLGLFLYSHLTEMSGPYEILANLLRCCQSKSYMMFPFWHLVKIDKKGGILGKRYLPSPKEKISHIKQLATACGEERISEILDGFFNNDIRNAFYHSDYAISEKEFRIIEGSQIGKESIPLEELSDVLTRCFGFYSAFFNVYRNAKRNLAMAKRFHRWPNYEVLELLSDRGELTGFKIHFPNGGHAMFERKKDKGTTALNFTCEEEGISLNVGDLDRYRKAEGWFVNGDPFEEYGTRYNPYGYWKPIIFKSDTKTITQKVNQMTNDHAAQGCLFYIFTTGHNAVEFVIRSNKHLFSAEEMSRPFFKTKKHLIIKKCENLGSSFYLYDGTVYLNDISVASVEAAIREIATFMESFKRKDSGTRYRLKYQSDLSPLETQPHEDGSLTVTLRMDDPRNTLVASDLSLFPKSDWKIKSEWV